MSNNLQSSRRIARIFTLKHRLAKRDLLESLKQSNSLEAAADQIGNIKDQMVMPSEPVEGSTISSYLEFRSRLIDLERQQRSMLVQALDRCETTIIASNAARRGMEQAELRLQQAKKTCDIRKSNECLPARKTKEVSCADHHRGIDQ